MCISGVEVSHVRHCFHLMMLLHGRQGFRGWAGGLGVVCAIHSHLTMVSKSVPAGLQFQCDSAIKNVLSGNTRCFASEAFFLPLSNLCEAFLRLLIRVLNKLSRGTCYVSFSTWNPWKKIHKANAPRSIMDSVGKLCSSFGLSSEL